MGACSSDKNRNYYYYIWIDANINNFENSEYIRELSRKYPNISIFNNIKDAMKHLENIKFYLTYIIVSGSLFTNYISKFNFSKSHNIHIKINKRKN